MSRAVSVCHGAFGRATIYELNRPMVTHAHREGHLLFHLGGSPGTVTVRGTPIPCDGSGIVTINPWEPHSFTASSALHAGVFFVMYIRPGWLERIVGTGIRGSRLFGASSHATNLLMERMLRQAISMMDDPPGNKMLETLLGDICQLCSEQTTKEITANEDRGMADWRRLDFRIRKSLDVLSGPIVTEATMLGVARASGLSRAHFFKLFRQNTGVTPLVFANTLRIERSLLKLATPQATIRRIGDELGFSCQSTFSRFFASHVGMAPQTYRKAIRTVGDVEAA
jgi:AraC-like DNA-binding protein